MVEKLNKVLETLDTRQFANIFRNYMEQQNIKKYDGRKKDNSNTYFIEGKEDHWDRVFCVYTNDKGINEIGIVFRKRAGLYLIIKYGSRVIFETIFNGSRRNNYFDKLLFNEMYKNHKVLFDELFKLI